MIKVLDWSQLNDRPISIGRNGSIKTSGLDIFSDKATIHIVPITSRGNLSNCSVSIPKSEIHNLINILKTF